MIESAVAVITRRDGAILLTKRGPGVRSFPGLWCLPGGVVEPHETPAEAALREAAEEVGVRCYATEELGCFDSAESHRGLRYRIHAYRVTEWEGDVVVDAAAQEVSDYLWLRPGEALVRLALAGPATESILRQLDRQPPSIRKTGDGSRGAR